MIELYLNTSKMREYKQKFRDIKTSRVRSCIQKINIYSQKFTFKYEYQNTKFQLKQSF